MFILYHSGVAEDILDKCTLNNSKYENLDDKNYSVLFNYEFIEDTRDERCSNC